MSAAADPALDGAYGPVRRKEDARFLRGQGTFVDDIQLPGMLHGAILRSPLAHARIVSVDTAAARGASPGPGRHHRRDAGAAQAGLDAHPVP